MMRKAFVSMLLAFLPGLCLPQNESATLSGRVPDPTAAAGVGRVEEAVRGNANEVHMNRESATVSSVVDRQFAENLPMNGRSFQTLIQLTPGVVVTPSTNFDSGQFSVNGQRASSNYFMV